MRSEHFQEPENRFFLPTIRFIPGQTPFLQLEIFLLCTPARYPALSGNIPLCSDFLIFLSFPESDPSLTIPRQSFLLALPVDHEFFNSVVFSALRGCEYLALFFQPPEENEKSEHVDPPWFRADKRPLIHSLIIDSQNHYDVFL